MATRSLLLLSDDTYNTIVQDYSICQHIYWEPLIPVFDRDSEFLLILCSLEFFSLCSLWFILLIKGYYICIEKNIKKAKAILLPYYDKILYWYSFIAILRILFALCQYLMVRSSNLQHQHIESLWYVAVGEAISSLCILTIELFIVLLIMQTSVGKNAFYRAMKGTICICAFIAFLMTLRISLGSAVHKFENWLIFSLCIHGFLLLIYVFIFFYVLIFMQNVKKMRRKRNEILYFYLFAIAMIHCLFVVAYILELSRIDGFCFVICGQYLYKIIFPIIAFVTIYKDSKFWKQLIYQWQFVSNTSMENDEISQAHNHKYISGADDLLLSGTTYRQSMVSIFGDHRKQSYYDPIVSVLELEINMISYDELENVSDPFAMGSTAMVHRAMYKNQDVAVKKWMFDEIDLSLEYITEFFRETLFSNIIHPNLVQFKGACLSPPELCLVYEYVNCGDLAHLILSTYFNSAHPRHREAIKMRNRLSILIGICEAMIKLHSEGIIHRDLKTSNVLVQFDETTNKFIAKVCDFGSARKLNAIPSTLNRQNRLFSNASDWFHHHHHNKTTHDQTAETNQIRMTTQVGTIAFMAPELLSRVHIESSTKEKDRKQQKQSKNGYELLTELEEISKNGRKWSTHSTYSDYTNHRNLNGRKLFSSLQQILTGNTEENNAYKTNKYKFKFMTHEVKHSENESNGDTLTSIYDKSVDVFSFGIMMFEIGFLHRVYDQMTIDDIYDLVTNNKAMHIESYSECQKNKQNGFYIVSDAVYEKYIKLMRDCQHFNAEKRPTFEQIKERLIDIEIVNHNF